MSQSYLANLGNTGFQSVMNYNPNYTSSGFKSMSNGSNWGSAFGNVGGFMQGASNIMSGLSGIGNMYNAFQANKLAREQFEFEKASYATNLANQGKMINTAYDSAANISAQLGATTPGDSLASSQAIADYKKNAKNQHVATSIS